MVEYIIARSEVLIKAFQQFDSSFFVNAYSPLKSNGWFEYVLCGLYAQLLGNRYN